MPMNANEIQSAERYARQLGIEYERWSNGPRCLILKATVRGTQHNWDHYGTAIAHLRALGAKP